MVLLVPSGKLLGIFALELREKNLIVE